MLPQDPAMLMSFVNMKLRDEFSSLEDLCACYGISPEELKTKLAAFGFDWTPAINQFR